MKRILYLFIFIFIKVYANQVFLELNEDIKSVIHNDLKFFIDKNDLYCENIKNKNLYKILENIEPKIEIISFENLYAVETSRGQVNISYSLYRLENAKMEHLNIDVVNPIFKKDKIFSYERSGPQWYLDIYCKKSKNIVLCGKGELSQTSKNDLFITMVDKKKVYYNFNAEIISSITNKKQPLYKTPNKKTKMYLIKGDKVEILKEKDDWLYILYRGKKDIKAWIPKSSVE